MDFCYFRWWRFFRTIHTLHFSLYFASQFKCNFIFTKIYKNVFVIKRNRNFFFISSIIPIIYHAKILQKIGSAVCLNVHTNTQVQMNIHEKIGCLRSEWTNRMDKKKKLKFLYWCHNRCRFLISRAYIRIAVSRTD